MTDTKSEYDRLMRGFLLAMAMLAGARAIVPLLPTASMESAAFAVLCAAMYGVWLVMTADPTIGTIKRIVPKQYH